MKLSVASPCKRSWAKMSGGEAVRFCADCRLNVYNLSVLSEEQVLALVKEKEGRLCVRFFTRPDGTVLTRDCSVGVARKRRTYAVTLAAVASLFAAPFFAGSEETQAHANSFTALAWDVVHAVKRTLWQREATVGRLR